MDDSPRGSGDRVCPPDVSSGDSSGDPTIGVIIAAGGSGSRFGEGAGGLPKTLYPLLGEPILIRTVRAFLLPYIERIVVAVPGDALSIFKEYLSPLSEKIIAVPGGKHREESVRLALEAMPPEIALILVQDGARPFASEDIILRVITAARRRGAAIAAVKSGDTLKRSDPTGLFIEGGIDREGVWRAQTPQGFKRDILYRALESPRRFEATDEASLVSELLGIKVSLTLGSEENIKITFKEDLVLAEAIAAGRDRARAKELGGGEAGGGEAGVGEAGGGEPCGGESSEMAKEASQNKLRVGEGFDFHAFAPEKEGIPLMLGCLPVPFDKRLLGHSDADVLTHALIDALLGAGGLGDIGTLFPDKDPAYRGASGEFLLKNTWGRLKSDFLFINGDLTFFGEEPKIAPYASRIKEELSRILEIDPERLNLKGKTTERMGFLGRGEGLGAAAVVLLLKRS